MKVSKSLRRRRIRYRIRKSIIGSSVRPRMAVFRSNKQIYVQLIDDEIGATLINASSKEEGVDNAANKSDQAKQVGKIAARRALDKGIVNCVFDRGGYLYHGRVKALAEGAREEGLQL